MRIIHATDYDDMSRKAADMLAAQVILKPRSVLGLATGSSPVGAYRELTARHRAGVLSFRQTVSVNLDEYAGLAPENPASYRYFMEENLFRHIDILPENTFVPDGLDPDPGRACERYDSLIESFGGIDLQLLGIGANGHIGFNEPGPAFEGPTHKAELTGATIESNKRFFEHADQVPRFAYTVGIRAIMQAGRVLLIASGIQKAGVVLAAVRGPVTPELPASILQLHRDVTLIGDREALSLL